MADIRINSLPSTATSFNTDDYIAIDGASGGTRKMLAANPPFSDVTLGASGPSVKSTLSARAPRQGLVFDGTAGATVANVPAIGTGNFTVVAFANPTVGADRCILSGLGSSPAWYLLSTGYLRMNKLGVGTASDSTSTVPSGKFSMMCYTRSGTTGSHYINGVAAGSATDSFDYTTAITRIGTDSGNFWNSNLVVLIYNRALSASEVVALYEAGAPAGADYNSASNTALSNGTWTNDSGTYSTFSGASATGFTAVKASGAGYAYSTLGYVPSAGTRVRVTGTLTLNNGKTVVPTIYINGTAPVAVSLTAGSFSVDVTSPAGNSDQRLVITSTGDADFTLSSFAVKRIGLLLAPDAAQAGGGLVWYDTSGNAANITLPASGVSWNVPSSRVLGGNWTTSGNLTVSGTGTSSFAGKIQTTSANGIEAIVGSGNTGLSLQSGSTQYSLYLNAADNSYRLYSSLGGDRFAVSSGGNFLLKSDGVDSSNGKLQLATHTTSAGGIGFGTDSWLYRESAGLLNLGSGGNAVLKVDGASGSVQGMIIAKGGSEVARMSVIGSGTSLVFSTGSSVLPALTLDNTQQVLTANSLAVGGTAISQRLHVNVDVFGANKSGGMRIGNSGNNYYSDLLVTTDGSSNPFVKLSFLSHQLFQYAYGGGNNSWTFYTNNTAALGIDSSQNSTFTGNVTAQKSSGSDVVLALNQIGIGQWTFKNEATTGNFKLSIGGNDWVTVNRTTGATTLPGSIAIGNTVQTAAAVASTHKVTISIGGTTYYLLATNV